MDSTAQEAEVIETVHQLAVAWKNIQGLVLTEKWNIINKDNYGKDETLETKGGHTTKYTTYRHTTRLTLHEWTYNKLNKAPMSPKVIFLQKK